jgi:hypothetical protein
LVSMAPSSQESEPPGNPGRFNSAPAACVDAQVAGSQRRCGERIIAFGRGTLSDMNDKRRIADEAVGQRPESAIPDAAKDRVPEGRPATSAGPHASVATKTAEALGETVGDAYAYPDATAAEVRNRSREFVRRRPTGNGSGSAQPFMMAASGFAFGYVAALLIHHRG